MKRLLPLAVAAAFATLATGAHGAPKTARCAITAAEGAAYRGPCHFLAEKGGSFDLSPLGKKLFFDEIGSISVFITGKGMAEVSGLTQSGINSRWGEARRSRRDAA